MEPYFSHDAVLLDAQDASDDAQSPQPQIPDANAQACAQACVSPAQTPLAPRTQCHYSSYAQAAYASQAGQVL